MQGRGQSPGLRLSEPQHARKEGQFLCKWTLYPLRTRCGSRSVKEMADRSYMIPSRDGLANLVRVPPCVSFRVANFAIFLVRNIA